ncbi:MAG: hypothetical protein AVDCRST_MAG40-3046 [uncultured Gemmatimonadaceae bacterium]|uniref:CHRD domain-containing protein n=1 Tax=uncultured Gemmatimonadaceae bacterium TaxID=246130 RepID=A0A6J4MCA1_9BACT|nr:MAG: hypothetical protein AVDCRST_MAG40-3046 [uncultured Gemmatimonadaceae bacterium]
MTSPRLLRRTPTRAPHPARALRLGRAALALGAALVAAGCLRTRRDPVTGRVAVDVRSPLQKGTVWDAKLSSQTAPFYSAVGTVRADVIDGQTTLALRVTGLSARATHPWRVHEGKCGAVGAQFGESSAYAPLLVNAQGVAEGTAKLPALDIARNYKVRLFVSVTDSTSEVVCGNLVYR